MADNKAKKQEKKQESKGQDKKNLLGIDAQKEANFSDWYSQVIIKAELISYYDISGCYILRPWSYSLWESIKDFFDKEIKRLGVQNAYFPLFVSEKALKAEKDHIEGFAPEVAWVTKSGKSALKEPIAVRPTSETIMYPAYASWIRSHRDLPLKLNQWVNVVRWEFKKPTPFIRSREFLWQEGHTAFATLEEAAKEVMDILNLYRDVYEGLLAVPVIRGKKTENEKFPGGYYTTTVEAFIPTTGRGIQAATSHCLGQNFAKMFKIEFENENGAKDLVWQNSWGLTTRSIGIMIMTHGDNQGLILPPRVAPYQVVIVPIPFKDSVEEIKKVAQEVAQQLTAAGVRVFLDDRENYNPGWKFNNWEMKGVPLRLEIGPKDVENKTVLCVRRDLPFKEAKQSVARADVAAVVPKLLEEIQENLLARATKTRDERIAKISKWEEFVPALDQKKMALAPWCEVSKCEDTIKEKSGQQSVQLHQHTTNPEEPQEEGTVEALTGAAKSLCIPFDQPPMAEGTTCFHCGAPAKVYCLFGRSY